MSDRHVVSNPQRSHALLLMQGITNDKPTRVLADFRHCNAVLLKQPDHEWVLSVYIAIMVSLDSWQVLALTIGLVVQEQH